MHLHDKILAFYSKNNKSNHWDLSIPCKIHHVHASQCPQNGCNPILHQVCQDVYRKTYMDVLYQQQAHKWGICQITCSQDFEFLCLIVFRGNRYCSNYKLQALKMHSLLPQMPSSGPVCSKWRKGITHSITSLHQARTSRCNRIRFFFLEQVCNPSICSQNNVKSHMLWHLLSHHRECLCMWASYNRQVQSCSE